MHTPGSRTILSVRTTCIPWPLTHVDPFLRNSGQPGHRNNKSPVPPLSGPHGNARGVSRPRSQQTKRGPERPKTRDLASVVLVACPATRQERALWLRIVSIRILAVPIDRSHEVLPLVFHSRRSLGRQLGIAWTTNSAFPKRQARCLLRTRRNEAKQSDSLNPSRKWRLLTVGARMPSRHRMRAVSRPAAMRSKCQALMAEGRGRGSAHRCWNVRRLSPVQWPWQGGMRAR